MLRGTTGGVRIPALSADLLSRVVDLCLRFLKSSEFIVGIDEGIAEACEHHPKVAEEKTPFVRQKWRCRAKRKEARP